MKPPYDEPSDESTDAAGTTLSRRQAIQRIGGGILTAVVAPRGLGFRHGPESIERSNGPSGDAEPTLSNTDSGPSQTPALPRSDHTTTLFSDGRLLVTGGRFDTPLSSVEIYAPMSGQWWPASSMNVPRYAHAATLLPDGRVLVAGGFSDNALSTVEIYDPKSDLWSPGASLSLPRYGHTAVTLPNGYVLVSGGEFYGPLSSMEAYDPANDRWSSL